MGTIALLTDFGERDGFVGMMKGAILKVAPQAQIIDMTHTISSFDIKGAAFLLQKSVKHYSPATVFVTVVDPGVGTERKIIAASAGSYFFVAPDNGILSYALSDFPQREVVSVENRDYFADSISYTFQGRDIMAPVAAHISQGLSLCDLGPPLENYQRLPLLKLLKRDRTLIGEIVYVDKFGNMISNISCEELPSHRQLTELSVRVGEHEGLLFVNSYAQGRGLAATVSGLGTVEVFVYQDSAAAQFAKPIGTVITVEG
ncbi:MAG: SAM-dependent chlorinase/fluorinase [candidate division Zixibacteria bacterium]|nr:SAM-dependent chlorinase/fluorinase [candidate division Zixibacteria bacterium]